MPYTTEKPLGSNQSIYPDFYYVAVEENGNHKVIQSKMESTVADFKKYLTQTLGRTIVTIKNCDIFARDMVK